MRSMFSSVSPAPSLLPAAEAKADGHPGRRIVVANVIDAAAAIDPVGASAAVERVIAVAPCSSSFPPPPRMTLLPSSPKMRLA